MWSIILFKSCIFCFCANSFISFAFSRTAGVISAPPNSLASSRMESCSLSTWIWVIVSVPCRCFQFQMTVCHSCNLRQMRDAEYLMMLSDHCHLSETFCAVLPLIPVSISSKINVSISSLSARIAFNASMIRDNSPPDTICPSGFRVSPGFVEMRYWISSVPLSV